MKKILAAVFVMFAVVSSAMAVTTGSGLILVSCTGTPAVAISTAGAAGDYADPVSTFTLGALNTGISCALSPFYIWNTSAQNTSAVQTYTLQTPAASTIGAGTQWTYITAGWPASALAAGQDTVAVGGLFKNGAQPVFADYTVNGTANNLINNTVNSYDATHLNPAASPYSPIAHGNATAGTPSARMLWIMLVTPSSVSNTNTHQIQINVTAALAG